MSKTEFIQKFLEDTRKERSFVLILTWTISMIFTIALLLVLFRIVSFNMSAPFQVVALFSFTLWPIFCGYEVAFLRYKFKKGHLKMSSSSFKEKLGELIENHILIFVNGESDFMIIRDNSALGSSKEVYLFLENDIVYYNSRPYRPTGFRDGLFPNKLPKEIKDLFSDEL